jgi:hypothetical protein
MFVCSRKIEGFIYEIRHLIKFILETKLKLRASTNRFYNRDETCSYPIKILVYNDRKCFGYFDPEFYELGFHECLMRASDEQRANVVKHELAHYMTFIEHGPHVLPHGKEFHEFCKKMGWSEAVSKATATMEELMISSSEGDNRVLSKVQKLMALSTSSNQHESEQAMIKSQKLLLKYNVDAKFVSDDKEEEKMFLKRIIMQKKRDAKLSMISRILQTFFVSPVFCRGDTYTYLEILGTAVNIQIAEYVAHFLEEKVDELWGQARKLYPHLKGITARNSFMHGIAEGYCRKVEALKREYSSIESNAVLVIENQLQEFSDIAYGRLRTTKSSARHCQASSEAGRQFGENLRINPALEKTSQNTSKAQLQFTFA